MRASLSAAVIAVSILGWGTAWAACPAGLPQGCVVNLGLTPQASQQIVGDQSLTPTQKANPNEPAPFYTGPTIGAAPNLQRAPEIGYRWAIN